ALQLARAVVDPAHADAAHQAVVPVDDEQCAVVRRVVVAGEAGELVLEPLEAEIDACPGLVFAQETADLVQVGRRRVSHASRPRATRASVDQRTTSSAAGAASASPWACPAQRLTASASPVRRACARSGAVR